MKVVQTIYTGSNWMTGEDDVDRCVEVAIINAEGTTVSSVSFSEGEPEDMTLGRDLNDVYNIADLVETAYQLGRKGVDVSFEYITEEY